MPRIRLPPTIIMSTVWLGVLASSSANLGITLRRADVNFSGQ